MNKLLQSYCWCYYLWKK